MSDYFSRLDKRKFLYFLWLKNEHNNTELSRLTKMSRRGVQYNVKKFKEGKGFKRKKGSGRVGLLDYTDQIILGEIASENKYMSNQQLANKIVEYGCPLVSHDAIRRYLKLIGFMRKKPRKVPILTELHKAN